MKVSDQQVIDSLQTGISHCRKNAIGVARLVRIAGMEPFAGARKSRVDQETMAIRRYQQRRLPAFNINEVDRQFLAPSGMRAQRS